MWEWLPWRRPSAPAVDVHALAQEVAAETARALLTVPTSATPPTGSYPVYAHDHPYWWTAAQAPQRRPGSPFTLRTLRQLADTYDILRSCIQHLKREVAAVPRRVTPLDDGDDSPATKAEIGTAQAFIDGAGLGPGRRRSQFESELIEDLCVVGAAAVFYALTRGSKPYKCLAIDAATIRPRVDAYGWPGPGEDLYEQWIDGIQVRGFQEQDLYYDGMYPRSYTPYFASPVEWLVNAVNAALRSDQWNLTFLTKGTTVGDMIALPETWTPDQVWAFKDRWDALLEGNSAGRQQTRFVPGGSQRVGSQSRKEHDLQEYDLWLLRRTCSVMGVQPASIGYTGEQYKVSQDASMAQTTAFGAGELLEWFAAFYNDLLKRCGWTRVRVVNVTQAEEDAKQRSERLEIEVRSGQTTPNEARSAGGKDALPGGEKLFVLNTLVPLEQAIQPPPAPGQEGAPTGAPSDTWGQGGPSQAKRQALIQWQRKAMNRLKEGRPPRCEFDDPSLPDGLYRAVLLGLGTATDNAAVRAVFDRAGQFEEEKHLRQQGGKFASKGGSEAETAGPGA